LQQLKRIIKSPRYRLDDLYNGQQLQKPSEQLVLAGQYANYIHLTPSTSLSLYSLCTPPDKSGTSSPPAASWASTLLLLADYFAAFESDIKFLKISLQEIQTYLPGNFLTLSQ